MRIARRLTLVGALLAIAWGVSRLVVPVHVDVGSAVNGVFDDVLPGSLDETKLSCGNVLAPREFGPTVAETPERLLHSDCGRAVNAAKGSAVAWAAFGFLTAFLGVTLLRDPRRASRQESQVAGATVGGSPLRESPTPPSGWNAPRPVAPPRFDLPPLTFAGEAPEFQAPEPTTARPARRFSAYRRTGLAVGGAVAVLLGLAVRSAGSEPSTSRVVGNAPSSEPAVVADLLTFDPDEQSCISEAMDLSDELYEIARVASERDRDQAVLNLDGDSSWAEYSTSLGLVDVRACPHLFQGAFRTWVAAWGSFGADRQGGGGNTANSIRLLQAAYDALVTTAAEVEVHLPKRIWTVMNDD